MSSYPSLRVYKPGGPLGWLILIASIVVAFWWAKYGHRAMLERYGSSAVGHYIIRMPGGAFRYRYTLGQSNYFFDYRGDYAPQLCVKYLPIWPSVRIVTGPAKEGVCGCGG